MQADDILGIDQNFASLSLRDLLEARDQYHWHLVHKPNVVGTAVGRYRIRKMDPWPSKNRSDGAQSKASAHVPKEERRFDNSEIRDYSWPCVLVFVDQWLQPTDFDGTNLSPDQMVPKTLYMPDGRTVPVCVVKITYSAPDRSLLPAWQWPEHMIGGGFPIISESQGERNVASTGLLVTDGHLVYALTSRHVSGAEGHPMSTVLRGRVEQIGTASDKQLTRLPFSEVYTEFPGRRTFLTLDAGLVVIDKLADWTSQVYGLPRLGMLADLSERNVSTRLINAEVRAYGAATGDLRGRVAALFFRYRSVGGYDDVTDFLIAPEDGTPHSQPGDSGTVWHLVMKDGDLRPLALQWGGQGALSGGGSIFNFALAASLTNVLRLLNVEIVVDHNIGAQPFWGKTGHYSIATFACDSISDESPHLQKLMQANQDRISFKEADLKPKDIDAATKKAKTEGRFVPLADVPDVIWKNTAKQVKGGRDPSPRQGPEHPVHYADIDKPRPSDGKTLRELSLLSPDNVTVPFWQAFYDECDHKASKKRGLLPFRVWQFYDAMVDAVRREQLDEYVCAAGILAHYVGDACQPLHGSVLADGFEDGTGEGVHSVYETTMVDHQAPALLDGLQTKLPNTARPGFVTSGWEAAVATVELMDRAARNVDPKKLVKAYAATDGGKSKAVTSELWTKFGKGTVATMCDGVMTLAMIWESAWKEGKGETKFPASAMKSMNKNALRGMYERDDFVPSLDLDHIQSELKGHP